MFMINSIELVVIDKLHQMRELQLSEQKKENLQDRLGKLLKAFKNGRFTDETFSLIEIEIKRIQAELMEIEIVKEITQPAKAVEPVIEEKKINEDEVLLKKLTELNNLFKS